MFATAPPTIPLPLPPIITDDGLEVTVGYNDTCINNTFMGTVNFTCVVVGGRTPVTIEWLVDGEVFTGDSHSVIISVNETASLLVIGIDNGATVEQDLKNYTCQATNRDGNDTSTTPLLRCGEVVMLCSTYVNIWLIETGPVIDIGVTEFPCPTSSGNIGGNYSALMDQFVIINCTLIDGFPIPNISWFYMDDELTMFRDSPTINITVTNDTIGLYSCKVVNELGNETASSYVDILS